MAILKLLSEEVFDFSRREMTQQKIEELKQSLSREFQLIHELCLSVLSASQSPELIKVTLATLHAFLSWIPLGCIFESHLLETLLEIFHLPAYHKLTLQCLTEVAALNCGDLYDLQYIKMYSTFVTQLQNILPSSTNIPQAYAAGNSEQQAFIHNLTLFFTSFFKFHIRILEATPEGISALLVGLEYLTCISYVDDMEVFKVGEPFVSELLTTLPTTVVALEPHQSHTFYASVGHFIQLETDAQKREEYLQRLMHLPNKRWNEIMGQVRLNVDQLRDPDNLKAVLDILQTNTSAATSLGTFFRSQISNIFMDILTVYRMDNEIISSYTAAQEGPLPDTVNLLRSVKREILKLIETFLDQAEDQQLIRAQFVSPVMELILCDNLSYARESEVLSIFATIINKYKVEMMENNVSRILEAVLPCTLEMNTKNFDDYTEHHMKFFWLLHAIATHCFLALIRLSSEQLKLVMDSIIWAFRHTERNIAEIGLRTLLEMLKNVQATEFCNRFHKTYFLVIEQEICASLMDTFHKPWFELHVSVLQNLICLAESGPLTESLWDVATVSDPYPNNGTFVREYTIKILSTSFPNITEVSQLVNDLFTSSFDPPAFKNCIREFLVQLKEFSSQDNKDLYAEEAVVQRAQERQRWLSIPGLIAPNEIQDEMVDSEK